MCLSVMVNGINEGYGTHISVYNYVVRGEFDSQLKWPFRGTFTIQLVNQLKDEGHHTRTISYADMTPDMSAAQVTDGERALGWGWIKFLLQSELGLSVANNCQYLEDDCLFFRIVSIKLI